MIVQTSHPFVVRRTVRPESRPEPAPRERRPLDKLPRKLRESLSEKFYAECARGVDPFEAAERIGCELRPASDGVPEVWY